MTKASEHPRWAALSSKRQDELLNEYRDVNVDHKWWDFTYEWFKTERGPNVGIEIDDISFSGFWSQGDGACFSGGVGARGGDWELVLKAVGRPELLAMAKDEGWYFRVSTSGRYSHAYTMTGDLDAYLPDNPYDEEEEPLQHSAWGIANPVSYSDLDRLEEELTGLCRDLANELYRALEEEYEYLTDDETVIDYILDNLDDDELKDPNEETEEDTNEQELLTA
jgi:hypothetical protein